MDTRQKKPNQRRPAKATGGFGTEKTAKRTTRSSGAVAAKAATVKKAQKVTAQRKTATRRRAPAKHQISPDVVYTQPGPFLKSRFILHLVTVVAVVMALLFGMAIFFKVEVVTVAGTEKYTEWDVREASGIREGENLLTLSEARISSNIISALPYVDTVRFGIKLPDTVKIEIKELDVVYAVEAQDGSWWLMRADGGIADKTNYADAEMYTRVLGFVIVDPQVGQKAVAYQPVSQETTPDGQPVPVTVQASQQLDIAVSILEYLEERRVLGEIASVDVSDIQDLQMWYADRFQVLLGDQKDLARKIGSVTVAIRDYMESYDSGVLDASMTVQPDPEKSYEVIFTPIDE